MIFYDHAWHFRILCGLLMFMSGFFMVFHGCISPFLVVIDPNSFGLVKSRRISFKNPLIVSKALEESPKVFIIFNV